MKKYCILILLVIAITVLPANAGFEAEKDGQSLSTPGKGYYAVLPDGCIVLESTFLPAHYWAYGYEGSGYFTGAWVEAILEDRDYPENVLQVPLYKNELLASQLSSENTYRMLMAHRNGIRLSDPGNGHTVVRFQGSCGCCEACMCGMLNPNDGREMVPEGYCAVLPDGTIVPAGCMLPTGHRLYMQDIMDDSASTPIEDETVVFAYKNEVLLELIGDYRLNFVSSRMREFFPCCGCEDCIHF